jgi:uncharacterized protein (DUF2384 family)
MAQRIGTTRATESPELIPMARPSLRLPRQVGSLRAWFGLSQEAFGEALGVSRSTVVRWEREGTRPDPRSAEGGWFAVLAEVKRLAWLLWPDDPSATRHWFRSRSIPVFRGRRPIDVVTSPKGLLHVYRVLLAETEGGYS